MSDKDNDNELRINELEAKLQRLEDKVTALVELQKISNAQLDKFSAMFIHPGAR